MKKISPRLSVGTLIVSGLALPIVAQAHCPLCTAGAGLVALAAYSFGVNGLTIGVLLGAFAIALGLWLGKLIKRNYIPRQTDALGILSWLTTILPLQIVLSDYASVYINWSGSYGSWLNRTYVINLFLVGAAVGGLIIYLSPRLSRTISQYRSKTWPYQGLIITLSLTIITALVTQLVF